jgi:enoyl-CoA hydratase/carnithine racemase
MPADTDMLRVERDDAVLRLVLDRPERRNALHPEQLAQLVAVVSDMPDDVALVTLEGAGDAAFSAGFDIKVLAAAGHGERPSEKVFEAAAALAGCPVPTLAVVRGFCLGAGFDLATACDFRIGTPTARFGVPAVRIATVYEPRSVDRIRRLLGPTVTKELFVLGREFDADRALAVGLLQEVVAADALADAVRGWIPPSREVAAAHKRMVDLLEVRQDRPAELWLELDALRERSVSGADRQAALGRFVSRSSGGDPIEGDR